MKFNGIAFIFAFVALVAGGCFSRHAGPIYHYGDDKPPAFIVGPMAAYLTNLGGFSAEAKVTTTTPGGDNKTIAGEILGREGRLIFQPSLGPNGKRTKSGEGLVYTWDEAGHTGYVISDALQGYAPLQLPAATVGPPHFANDGIREVLDGHHCHRSEAVVELSDGGRARLTVWRADDAKHFPVRVECADSTGETMLRLTAFRGQLPPATIFRPPEGFTRYGSPAAMVDELILRDARLGRKTKTAELEEPHDNSVPNWHQLPTP